jgi:hypothetical protein
MGRSTQRAHELRVNRETDHLPLPLLFTQARYRSGGKNWVLWLSSTQGTYSLFSSCQEKSILPHLTHSLRHPLRRVSASRRCGSCQHSASTSLVPPSSTPASYHHLTHVTAPPCSRFQSRPDVSVARQSYLIFWWSAMEAKPRIGQLFEVSVGEIWVMYNVLLRLILRYENPLEITLQPVWPTLIIFVV